VSRERVAAGRVRSCASLLAGVAGVAVDVPELACPALPLPASLVGEHASSSRSPIRRGRRASGHPHRAVHVRHRAAGWPGDVRDDLAEDAVGTALPGVGAAAGARAGRPCRRRIVAAASASRNVGHAGLDQVERAGPVERASCLALGRRPVRSARHSPRSSTKPVRRRVTSRAPRPAGPVGRSSASRSSLNQRRRRGRREVLDWVRDLPSTPSCASTSTLATANDGRFVPNLIALACPANSTGSRIARQVGAIRRSCRDRAWAFGQPFFRSSPRRRSILHAVEYSVAVPWSDLREQPDRVESSEASEQSATGASGTCVGGEGNVPGQRQAPARRRQPSGRKSANPGSSSSSSWPPAWRPVTTASRTRRAAVRAGGRNLGPRRSPPAGPRFGSRRVDESGAGRGRSR